MICMARAEGEWTVSSGQFRQVQAEQGTLVRQDAAGATLCHTITATLPNHSMGLLCNFVAWVQVAVAWRSTG